MCLGESFEGQSDMHISVRLEIYFWQIWLTYFLKISEKSTRRNSTIKSKISTEEEKFSATFFRGMEILSNQIKLADYKVLVGDCLSSLRYIWFSN